MKWLRWALVLLGPGLVTDPASAQDFVYYNPYAYDSNASGATLRYRHHKGHGALSISVGVFAAQGLAVTPAYGPFLAPYPPLVTPYFGPIVTQPVTVITYRPTPVLLPGLFVDDDLARAVLPRRETELPLNPRPLPARPDPGQRPVDPRDRDKPKAPMPPEPLPAKPPEPVKPPPPKPPDVPRPEPEPRAVNARLIVLGKESFADLEYGRAAQRFRQATVVLPNDGQAYFLLAQTLFTLGKYQDAVDAIHTGMGLQPTWPASKFQPLELYGAHGALYREHLRRLEEAVERYPNDPVVLFLYAYQLWFDGRQEEARVRFKKALAGAADPAVIDRFLRAIPPGGGV